MTYIMSCVWLDYMVKCFQCKNCVGSSPKTKKCVASFLVPGDKIPCIKCGILIFNYKAFIFRSARGVRKCFFTILPKG